MKKIIKNIRSLTTCNHVVQMPPEVRKRKNSILAIEIISSAILDIMSFAVKGAQLAIGMKLNFIAFMFIMMYFLREVLEATIQTFTDTQKNLFNEQQDSYTTENVSNISNIVRGKVFSNEQGFSRIMPNSEVIQIMKDFIGYVWQFLINVPTAIYNVAIAIILAVGILVTEFLQTQNLKFTLLLSILLIICVFVFAMLYKIRFSVRKKYRNKHRILKKENEVLYNDIKNIEPLIKDEFTYRASLLIGNMKEKRITEKEETLKLNKLYVLRALTLAIFMVGIVTIEIYYAGGIEKITLELLTNVIAISTVYSTILNKVANILGKVEDISNLVKDAESVKPDFDNIMKVYEFETSILETDQNVERITVNPFTFSYPSATSVYKLENTTSFSLEKGCSYLVYGHTGCGKSTLMHLLTGKIKLKQSPISYGEKCERAYLASIMHEANGKLGSNVILEELTFSKDFRTLNHQKMIEVLKGTHIYYDVMHNIGLTECDDQKVLQYLKTTTIDQYSSGQKQRLSICKLLYNLEQKHQIVVFDEATNALDNETAKSVLKFVADFCQKDEPRIVFFVTHQVEITKEITQGSISFHSSSFPIFEIIYHL